MPIPEHNSLGPGFERRLKAALDKVTPPSPLLSSARYRSGSALLPRRAWRLVPILVAVTAAGAALTAAAATGSTNPVVWTERAGSAIGVSKPVANPKAAQTPRPQPSRETSSGQGTGQGRPTPSDGHEQEPQRSPEPTERPEASPLPQPSPTPRETPKPSPSPDSSNMGETNPTPSPDGQSHG